MADDPKRVSNLTARLLTAAVAVPGILWLLFWAPKWGFVALVSIVVVIAAFELSRMVLGPSRGLHLAFVALSLGVLAIFLRAPTVDAVLSSFIALTLAALLFGLAFPSPLDGASGRCGWLIAGPLYVGGLLATLPSLHLRPSGGSWVLLAMMLAWFADTGGYFAGRAFGRRKLYATISPKKTVEGLVGGLLGSVGGALWAHFGFLPSLPLGHAVALGIVGGALGQTGDLAESLIKRGSGVKDSGAILPGHGGILDRIDALMFTGAATWLYAEWFQ